MHLASTSPYELSLARCGLPQHHITQAADWYQSAACVLVALNILRAGDPFGG